MTTETENNGETGYNFEELIKNIDELAKLAIEDGRKAYVDGNKLAARRARKTANSLKKLLTPFRQIVQEKIKGKEKPTK